MFFHYIAADKNGKVFQSDVEANSLEEVLVLIAKQNWKPISVKPLQEVVKMTSRLAIFENNNIALQDKIFLKKIEQFFMRFNYMQIY